MRIHSLHPWNVSRQEALDLQNQLARKIDTTNRLSTPTRIAGADISMKRGETTAYAGIVVLDAATLEIQKEYFIKGRIDFPYIPGLLSFREAPLLLELFAQVSPKPHLIFFDGQGLAHPRKLGLASHMGLFLKCPTVGCAKSRLVGRFKEPGPKKGSRSRLVGEDNRTLGAAVRTREGCKPVLISIGHQIDLDTAVHWTLKCSRYRIPEPTRLAHLRVNDYRKSHF
ncbi:MAG: endonuclease V [Nitrospinaceae bacterium]|nr:endonuclease V [Nitrospinaceae bacterium]